VKQVLEERITALSGQQDALGKKQDTTNAKVTDVQKELRTARVDLRHLKEALADCQLSLDTTQNMQGYTLRGVKLLVRCVTRMIPDDHDEHEQAVRQEMDRFIRDGDDIDGDLESLPSYKASASDEPLFAHAVSPPVAHVVPPMVQAKAVLSRSSSSTLQLLPNKLFGTTFGSSPATDMADLHQLVGDDSKY